MTWVKLALRLLPSVEALYKFAPPIMRPCVKFAYRLAQQVYISVSDPPPDLMKVVVDILGANAGFTPAMASIGGLFTGRAIQLIDFEDPQRPFTPAEIGLDCNSMEECSKTLCHVFENVSKALHKANVNEIIKDVSESASIIKNEYIKETMLHEALHAVIARETFASTLIECIGWRIRFDMMYVLEKIYRSVGGTLAKEVRKFGFETHSEFRVIKGFSGLNTEAASKVLDKTEDNIKELSSDDYFRLLLQDGYQHHIYLRMFVGSIVIPFIEVITWCTLDYDIEKYLDMYVARGIFDENLHALIAENLAKILKKKHPARQTAIEAARAALDFPPSAYEDLKTRLGKITRPEDLAKYIQEEVLTRFEVALDESPVTRDSPRHKTLISAILYGVPVEKAPDIVSMFIEILNGETEIKHFLLNIVEEKGARLTGTYTSFFITLDVGGNARGIIYDPLSGLTCKSMETPIGALKVNRTGLVFNTLEDLVGDLSLALRGFLWSAYVITRRHSENELLVDTLVRYVSTSKEKMRDLTKKLLEKDKAFSQMLYKPDPQLTREVLKVLLYAVLRLGEDITNFRGLHALWILSGYKENVSTHKQY